LISPLSGASRTKPRHRSGLFVVGTLASELGFSPSNIPALAEVEFQSSGRAISFTHNSWNYESGAFPELTQSGPDLFA
jgi:hypothetical protein